jgi:hypothetical protein
MTPEERRLQNVMEAVVIVEGLKLLISQLHTNKQVMDRMTFSMTVQFMEQVKSKYSIVAATPVNEDIFGNFTTKDIDLPQLQRISAERYMTENQN